MPEHRALNICFHGIGNPARTLEPGEDRYWISVDEFHRILDEIATWPDVRISFDDGNASDVEIGFPALVERGLTATFFVLAGRFGERGSLSETDVIELHRGRMKIGTHGMDHVPWRRMSNAVRDRELVQARQRIAEVAGTDILEAALPLGQYDRKLLADLKGLGYRAVHTSDRRAARRGRWIQPRFSVTRVDTVQSLRDSALKPPPLTKSLELSVKGVLKRLR
ncbi:MAG TPA: polysaccharide deacetylase family protein [Nakamurella multipartita]|nr:polysaccharide deacetylase family protein [Nakamurella multipartita]